LNRIELARQIYKISHITGHFTLRSGATSSEYFDKYLFEANPETLLSIAEQMKESLYPGLFRDTQFLAGLEMGGIPVVTMLSQVTLIPALFVRKTAKTHGTMKLAEGETFDGARVVVVEDVVSSGGQINLSTKDLRDRGAIVTDAVCVIDRESGGRESLARDGIELHALFTMSELKDSVSA
jgi:orotate phosphoribosyltransferase